ncbi:MAG: hypothetical protein GY758_20430 [Fuerstiella sp.]|nr:hypothetical protein [Fuerstiella sp.]MCP4508886.1 hypothetical protein [Fuerstiella sp.]MDG2127064.1 hypothetical protein [Fuerstiella sp.]
MIRFLPSLLFLCIACCQVLPPVRAQQAFALQVEVLTQPLPGVGRHTQQWARVFQEMGRRARFRGGRNGEKSRLEDTGVRGRNSVRAVGILQTDGSLVFQDRRFVTTNLKPLEGWLLRLETYGADGPPNESPTWGLTEEQYTIVLRRLRETVNTPLDVRTPMELIDSLKLPSDLQVTFTDAGRQRAFPRNTISRTTDAYKGLSKGSVLAAALTQFGLGFRPKAGSGAGFRIEVDAGTEADNMFPVGWKNKAPITTVAPALAKSVSVDLEGAELDVLIQVIAERLEVPYFYSHFALLSNGTDVSSVKYSRKPDRLSLFRLMDIIGKKHDMGLSLRTDEAGHLFLWVTTADEHNAFRRRF